MQNSTIYHISIIQAILSCCGDFVAQCILVRTTQSLSPTFPIIYFIFFKNIPLLDCVGVQYPSRDHSFNISNRFPRSAVRQPTFFFHLLMITLQFIASISYLDRRNECRPRIRCTRTIRSFRPEQHTVYHQSRHVDDRECMLS